MAKANNCFILECFFLEVFVGDGGVCLIGVVGGKQPKTLKSVWSHLKEKCFLYLCSRAWLAFLSLLCATWFTAEQRTILSILH
jgi:hypothetical protein